MYEVVKLREMTTHHNNWNLFITDLVSGTEMGNMPSELGKICSLPYRCLWFIQKTLAQADTEGWCFHTAGGMDAVWSETRGSSCSAACICLCVRALSAALWDPMADLLEARLKARNLPTTTYPTFPALCHCLCNSIKTSWFYFYILNVFCILGFKGLSSNFKVFSSFYINFYLPQI